MGFYIDMLPVQTMGDARAARSEMKGVMGGMLQTYGAILGRMANTGPPWPVQAHIPDLTRASRISKTG